MDMSAFKQSYLNLRRRYIKIKAEVEERLHHKERIASKMNGFLLMTELKRNFTFRELSGQLNQMNLL